MKKESNMKIGIMNNPSKSVYDEAIFCGKAGFDFLDLTIEGPNAATIDIPKLRQVLDSYGLSITGHTDPCLPHAYPIRAVREACLQELERCAKIFSALGAKVMNVHPCYFCPPAMKSDLVTFNIDALAPIVEMLHPMVCSWYLRISKPLLTGFPLSKPCWQQYRV
jgi:hypothetical protein